MTSSSQIPAPLPIVAGRVSVITPTYNRLALLRETIASVAAQTQPDVEHLIVDDGSTDGTADFLRDHTGRHPGFIALHQANAGVSAARNRGLRAARGEFVVFLDSDDTLEPFALARFVSVMRDPAVDYCEAGVIDVDPQGGALPNAMIHRGGSGLFGTHTAVHGVCYRRSFLHRVGDFNPVLRKAEDTEFAWRSSVLARKTVSMADIVGHYRQHQDARLNSYESSTQRFVIFLQALDCFAHWLAERDGWTAPARSELATAYRFVAMRLGSEGDVAGKNRACQQIENLLRPRWHPLRLFALLRFTNGTRIIRALGKINALRSPLRP